MAPKNVFSVQPIYKQWSLHSVIIGSFTVLSLFLDVEIFLRATSKAKKKKKCV